MNLNQVKETLEAIGYPVKGPDWDDVLADLHCSYGAQKVGSSINTLGDAAPLYLKSGNIAFMIDNQNDLHRACCQIQARLKERQGVKPVAIPKEVRSRYIPEIQRALESEIDIAERVKRSLGIVDTAYVIKADPDTRTQVRKGEQIVDDLLSDDKQRNDKAVAALKALLIVTPKDAAASQ